MTTHTPAGVIAYRADVDGLRAVAIVPVVLYHAGVAPFSGGFVGVDVFFVISGYLITSFIRAQIKRDTFSFRDFYLRRVRRIFPALFVMMTICAAIGWIVLSPSDYRHLGESILATVLFSSNILFWRQAGYFAQPLEARPLLHTWSLGVEEQFYLVFPILLVLVSRFLPRRTTGIVLALCALSFGVNLLTVATAPRFAFYMAPPRFWELLIGALLAMGTLAPPRNAAWSEAVGLLGVVLIGAAILEFSMETTFPGVAALLPTAGAAAIIWAGDGRTGIVTRFLSHPAPVSIGKISYSFYLWHFPLLAFGSYVAVGGISLAAKLTLIALSLVLAVASWLYIEQPVRRGHWVFGEMRAIFGMAAAAVVFFGSFGLAAHLTDGFPGRISKPGLQILVGENDINPDRTRCLPLADPTAIKLPPACKFGTDEAAPEYALWGDSHAESLRAALDGAARNAGRSGVFMGYAGCIPELGVDRSDPGCHLGNELITDYLASEPSIHTVILAGRWGLWAEGWPYKAEGGKRVTTITPSGTPIDNHAALAIGLEAALVKLAASGKRIWLVGPIPEIGHSVPRSLYLNSLGLVSSAYIRPTIEDFNERESFVLPLISRLAEKYHARVIWPHHSLCDDRFCQVERDGRPLYSDDQHLARSAAISLSALFDPVFASPSLPDHPFTAGPEP